MYSSIGLSTSLIDGEVLPAMAWTTSVKEECSGDYLPWQQVYAPVQLTIEICQY